MPSEINSGFGIPMGMNRTGGDLKCQGHGKKKDERDGKKYDSSQGNKTAGKVER